MKRDTGLAYRLSPSLEQATRADARRVGFLLIGFQASVVLVFAGILTAFWYFQVSQHERFLLRSENNYQRQLDLRAPRGVILDRDGRVLAENRDTSNISLIRDQTEQLENSIATLSRVTGIDVQSVHDTLERHRNVSPSRPIAVVQNASISQIAAVAARRLELPGVVVEQTPSRYYPAAGLAAHSFGYVGEITEGQLEQEQFAGLRSGDIIGHAGLEHAYNHLLMGTDGQRSIVVDSLGREFEVVSETPPVEGHQLRLTIDYDLQKAAEDGFRAAGFNGAAVVLDPWSGDVLALVSLPAYDPNAFATGIDGDAWTALNRDRLKPLQNRALQGRYSPGSTFKIAMAVAALEEGVIDPDFKVACHGGAMFYGRYYRCHATHGVVGMEEALEKSCNTYFYTLGQMLDVDQIHKWSTALGLGELSGIDLPYEVQGLVPSRAWKQEATGERWYPGETISVAIGQGQVSVTPMSLAVMMATVANGGQRVAPRLLDAWNDGSGWRDAPRPETASIVRMSPRTIELVRNGLWNVVNRAGTGRRGRVLGRDVIGKTGTAQVISLDGLAAAEGTDRDLRDLRDHGWFVFAAPRDVPRIAGAVFAEHSEHGYLAAPIARHVMETFFAKADGEPLPVLPPPPPPPPPAPPTVAPDRADVPAGGSVTEPPAAPGAEPVAAGDLVGAGGGQ